jgi:hypothetical protein
LAIVIWRQGIKRETRWTFWHHLLSILRQRPEHLEGYLTMCAHNEHFLQYRGIVRQQIEEQLQDYLAWKEKQPSLVSAEVGETVFAG